MEAMQEYSIQHLSGYLPAMYAQQSAVGFYEKMGWIPIGGEFFEADILHRVLIYPPREQNRIEELKVWKDPESREDIRGYLKTLLK